MKLKGKKIKRREAKRYKNFTEIKYMLKNNNQRRN
jgi:hypothetical protein